MKFALGEMEFLLKENLLEITAKDIWGDVALGLNRADTILLVNELQAYLEKFGPDGHNKVDVELIEKPETKVAIISVYMENSVAVLKLFRWDSMDSPNVYDATVHTFKPESVYSTRCQYSPTGFCSPWEPNDYCNLHSTVTKTVNDWLIEFDGQPVNTNKIEAFLNEV